MAPFSASADAAAEVRDVAQRLAAGEVELEVLQAPQRADAAGWSDLRYIGIFALYLGSSLLLAALGFATFIYALGAGYWGWLLLPAAAVGVVLWRKQAAAATEAAAEAAAAAAAKLGLGMGKGDVTPDDTPTPTTTHTDAHRH